MSETESSASGVRQHVSADVAPEFYEDTEDRNE
jgi:hypothetical protein